MEPSAQETGLTEYVKAGFWIRWAALLIDNLILSIGGGVLGGCCGFFVGFFGAMAKAGQRETQLLAAVLAGFSAPSFRRPISRSSPGATARPWARRSST